ncbi:hypothetical protein NARC_30093 [Candidatus Nitrosocosmicus arcticus]|uniref:Uncharacterized protein n=1 Tax=Candidatus Nitrosocosmicus arcticus TaxID=2035267 RepID=A0A557SXP3_9ARCH|nr:hypothetical protein NARC_30093 [Candidatus Nitrosocosmicus arcticus]
MLDSESEESRAFNLFDLNLIYNDFNSKTKGKPGDSACFPGKDDS